MTKTWAKVLGWILIILGIIGFISNPIAGMDGFFHADTMHNIIDIILGALLIWAGYSSAARAASVMKWEGILFLIITILGWVIVGNGTGSVLGLMEVNGADNWLHLVLGIVLVWAGMKTHKGHMQQGI